MVEEKKLRGLYKGIEVAIEVSRLYPTAVFTVTGGSSDVVIIISIWTVVSFLLPPRRPPPLRFPLLSPLPFSDLSFFYL